MSVAERGPDGAEVNPFIRTIKYPAVNHPLPEVLREELRRIGRACGACRKQIDDSRGAKLPEVAQEYKAWQHKLDALLAKLRGEYSAPVERQFIGRWAPE